MKLNKIAKFVKTQVNLTIKSVIDVTEVVKNGASQIEIGSTTINGKKVTLIKNDFIFASCGQKDIPAGLACFFMNKHIIYVNSTWENSDDTIKEAILAHELGHIVLGHLDLMMQLSIKDRMLLPIKRSLGDKTSINMELEADQYAIDNGHAWGILNFLSDITPYTEEYSFNTKELDKRKRQALKAVWKEFGVQK